MEAAELLTRQALIWRSDGDPIAAETRLFAQVLAQPDAEQVLIAAIERAKPAYTRRVLLECLGRVQGPGGVEVLRSCAQTSGPGSRDVRTAALGGLTARLGVGATQDLRTALRHRDWWTRVNAMKGLLRVGDGSAWDDAFAVWSAWVKRGRRLWDEPESSVAVHLLYLLRDVEPGSERAGRLVQAVRSRAPVIDLAWYKRFWPDALPGGPIPENCSLPGYEPMLHWYLTTYEPPPEPPTTGLRFRVQYGCRLHGRGSIAVGEILTGGADISQRHGERTLVVDGSRLRTCVGVGAATVGGVEYSVLSLREADDLALLPGTLVDVLDGA